MATEKCALAHLARAGAEITVRVVPGSSREAVEVEDRGEAIRVRVTAPPEGGRANAAVQALLARALGVAKGRLRLVRGAAARVKVFRVE